MNRKPPTIADGSPVGGDQKSQLPTVGPVAGGISGDAMARGMAETALIVATRANLRAQMKFGFDGQDGEDGITIPGPPGPTGSPGAAGGAGATGPAGPAGFPGWDGMDGEDALTIPGPSGPAGVGAAGATGPAGPPGFGMDGEDGLDGASIPGSPGVAGAAGATGATGPQGPIGWGMDGEDGTDGMFFPGSITNNAQYVISALIQTEIILAGFNGADAATAYTEESEYARVATFNGNAQLDTAIKQFGTAALLLDGTGDFITFPSSTTISVANSDDHTIEGFLYCTNVAGGGTKINTITSKRTSGGAGEFSFSIDAAGKLVFVAYNSTTAVANAVGTTTLSNSTWYYYAAVRKFGQWKTFLGVPGGNATIEATADETNIPSNNTSVLNIGRDASNTARDFQGTLDEIRWTRRGALYTTTFPVPAAEFTR